MKKQNTSITVQGCAIAIQHTDHGDYFSLTDMARSAGGESEGIVKNWLRNKNTLEFLGVWEAMYNENFNQVEFDLIKSASGVNSFIISSKEWTERTHAIGIVAKTGRYGSGTYAHEDIATEFATWLSPQFRLFIIKEFKRLKALEAQQDDPEWTIRRILAKANYKVHTDAVKDIVIPERNLSPDKEGIAYADEAELLNRAVFGMTSQEWCKLNPTNGNCGNIRDHADIVQLTIISNLQSLSSTLIREGYNRMERFSRLALAARQQYDSLTKSAALAKQGKVLMRGLKPLDAPRPPIQEKPLMGSKDMGGKFKGLKEHLANIPRPGRKDKSE